MSCVVNVSTSYTPINAWQHLYSDWDWDTAKCQLFTMPATAAEDEEAVTAVAGERDEGGGQLRR